MSKLRKIAVTGQTRSHAPQSMQTTGSKYKSSVDADSGVPGTGWTQSTGRTSTHMASVMPMQGWQIV
ncbi:MAG: hypothetical protein OXP73_08675 [Chloroflexota bacterium]|nr:hypothetical protein [Chloroflexota bacterium]